MRPRYMTSARSAKRATCCRSWLIRGSPMPRSTTRSERRSLPRSFSRLARTRPGAGTSPIVARAVIVLPEPDSPTRASRTVTTANEMPRTTSIAPATAGKAIARSATSRIGSAMARIEDVAEAVGEEVEGEAGDQDRDARAGGDPPLIEDHRRAVGDHGAPFGGRRADAEAEEAEPGGGEDHAGKIERQPDDGGGQRHRQDVAEEEARSAYAEHLGGGEIIAPAERRGLDAGLARIRRPTGQRQCQRTIDEAGS